jgi:hypothetical protein
VAAGAFERGMPIGHRIDLAVSVMSSGSGHGPHEPPRAFLLKPFTPEELATKVRDTLTAVESRPLQRSPAVQSRATGWYGHAWHHARGDKPPVSRRGSLAQRTVTSRRSDGQKLSMAGSCSTPGSG